MSVAVTWIAKSTCCRPAEAGASVASGADDPSGVVPSGADVASGDGSAGGAGSLDGSEYGTNASCSPAVMLVMVTWFATAAWPTSSNTSSSSADGGICV